MQICNGNTPTDFSFIQIHSLTLSVRYIVTPVGGVVIALFLQLTKNKHWISWNVLFWISSSKLFIQIYSLIHSSDPFCYIMPGGEIVLFLQLTKNIEISWNMFFFIHSSKWYIQIHLQIHSVTLSVSYIVTPIGGEIAFFYLTKKHWD